MDEFERVEADDGYIGEAPQKVKCVKSDRKSSDAEQGAESTRVSQWAIEKLGDFKVNVPS